MLTRRALRTVLFDLDGTVIDTGPLIATSFRHATRSVLGVEIPDEELLRYVGGWGLRAQMERFDPERATELVEAYRAHVVPLHAELEYCSGMYEMLVELKARSFQLGLVTAKHLAMVRLAFDALPELSEFFVEIVTGEETEHHKPSPEPLFLALDRLGADPGDTAYVGDSPFDVEAAKAAGLRSIAVTWGGIHGEERLRAAGPDAIVSTPAELKAALQASPA